MKTVTAPAFDLTGCPKELRDDNVHLFPKLIQEAYALRKKHLHELDFPKKYLAAQKSDLEEQLLDLSESNPDLSPKEVLIRLISPIPEFVPADMIAELCSFVMKEWSKLKQPVEV